MSCFFQPKGDFFGSKNKVQIYAQVTEMSLKRRKSFAKQQLNLFLTFSPFRKSWIQRPSHPLRIRSTKFIPHSGNPNCNLKKKTLHLLHCAGCKLRYSYRRVILQLVNIQNSVSKLSPNPLHKRTCRF